MALGKNEKRELQIAEIMEKTGWNREETISAVKDAKSRIGINYTDYNKKEFYNIPVEKQQEEYQKLLEKRARIKKQKEENINNVAKKTGWTVEEANEKMKVAKQTIGISYKDYDKYDFHNVAEDKQVEKYEKIKAKKEAQKEINRERKEFCINGVMAATGWTREYTEEKVQEARRRTGCQYKEYYIFRFYQLTEEEQDQMCLIDMTKKISEKYNVNKSFANMLNDKAKTNEYFAKYMGRPWCVNTRVSADEFAEVFKNSNRIIYKPIKGIGGHGIQSFNINAENMNEVYNELAQLPDGVVEEYVIQHPRMSELSPGAVNTMRVVTIVSNTKKVTEDGKHMDVAYAALRIGGGTAVVDNFHSGGMVAAVDMETGKLVTDATDMEGNVYQNHPFTGVQIKGFEVPFFKETLAMIEEICAMDLVEGNIGWDIALTENGPVIIEVNVGPGIVLLQAPYAVEKKGVRHIMEKYLQVADEETTENEVVEAEEVDKKSNKEICIEGVMKATGLDREEAITMIKDARKRLSIKYSEYLKHEFYNIPVEEQAEKYEKILATKQKNKERKEECIEATMAATGWSRDYANAQIQDARKRLGIKYLEYKKYAFYNIPVEEQAARYEEVKSQKDEKKANKANEKLEAIEKIMKITGWSREETIKNVEEARSRTGCGYKEYLIYRFFDLTNEEQENVFLIKESAQIARKFDTNKKFRRMLTNKEETNKCFSEFLNRPWCVNTKISEKEFVKKFKDSKRVIYKPLDGNRGIGVEAFDVDKTNAKEVYEKLKVLPEGVVEQYVVQHPALSSLSPASVNTLRIVMIASNTKPVTPDGKYMDIAYSALRIGGGTSIVDNFHSGGMVAAVDLETGVLVTDAADMAGNVFAEHPLTGTKIKGFEIPYFKEAMQMAIDAHKKSKIEGYIGWDIAITEDGPVLIEINLRPGVVLLSMPYVSERKGMRDVMRKYLES